MIQDNIRSNPLGSMKFHCSQLRPILIQGAIDPERWSFVNRRFGTGARLEALGDAWRPTAEALILERRLIYAQVRLIDETLTTLSAVGGDQTSVGKAIVRKYHAKTRQNAALAIIAYAKPIALLGDRDFAQEYAGAARRMHDAMQHRHGE